MLVRNYVMSIVTFVSICSQFNRL